MTSIEKTDGAKHTIRKKVIMTEIFIHIYVYIYKHKKANEVSHSE
jgi:hypothetical protein